MRFNKKMYFKSFLRKRKRFAFWDKSIKIPHYLIGKRLILHKGTLFKTLRCKKYLIGKRAGEFVLTRKFFNQSHFLTKKRR